MFVQSRMTANPFTVTPEDSIPEALAVMTQRGVRHLPVVDGFRVVGVLSEGDIAAASPSRATSFSAGELRYLMDKLKVREVMTRNPLTIAPTALLEEVAVVMRDNKIEMLPVIDDGHLVGVITESAILDAFIEILGFRDRGTRLTMQVADAPGMLARIGAATARHHANVQHLAVYRGSESSTVVLGVNTTNTDELEADLVAEGCTIVAKLVNR